MQGLSGPTRLRFGLCADPHKDIMHDADQRLRIFIDSPDKRHLLYPDKQHVQLLAR